MLRTYEVLFHKVAMLRTIIGSAVFLGHFILIVLSIELTVGCSGKPKPSEVWTKTDIERIYSSVVRSSHLVKEISSFIYELFSRTDECVRISDGERFFNCSSTFPNIYGFIRETQENVFVSVITVAAQSETGSIEALMEGTYEIRGDGLKFRDLSAKFKLKSNGALKAGRIRFREIVFSGRENSFLVIAADGNIEVHWTDIVEFSVKDFRYLQYADVNHIKVIFSGDIRFSPGNTCIRDISGRFEVSTIVKSGDSPICPSEGTIKVNDVRFSIEDFSCESMAQCQLPAF